ncbi:MAG: IS200/IS605 family transposase [Acidobacteria bacterium]|nr:IS200/IS605 family transposase [Acidobacteriota bacterium]
MSAYHCNHVHLVFGTKNRLHNIAPVIQPKLWAYMAGIARNYGMHVDAINGMDDHAHVVVGIPPVLSVAKAIQVIKANSSRWVKRQGVARFEWQEEYGVFGVSKSHLAAVIAYVNSQPEHHKKRDFAGEFKALLEKHGIKPRT